MAEQSAQDKIKAAQIDKLKKFIEKAKTRSDVPFKIKAVQKNPNGLVTTMSGTIRVDDLDVEMFWNTEGKAMHNGIEYDLIIPQSITEFLKG